MNCGRAGGAIGPEPGGGVGGAGVDAGGGVGGGGAMGPELAAGGVPSPNPQKMATHVQVLGWLLIASGILTGLMGFIIVVVGGSTVRTLWRGT